MSIPICAVTGRIAGDSDACGDCDPCGAAHTVPEAVKRLLKEKDEWREKYGTAMEERDGAAYMAGALRTIVAVAERDKLNEIYGLAQSGLGLAELGPEGCAEMRED